MARSGVGLIRVKYAPIAWYVSHVYTHKHMYSAYGQLGGGADTSKVCTNSVVCVARTHKHMYSAYGQLGGGADSGKVCTNSVVCVARTVKNAS